MELSFPACISTYKLPGSEKIHRVEFLFLDGCIAEDEILQRAINRAIRHARKKLSYYINNLTHAPFERLFLHRDIQSKILKLNIDLRDRMVRGRWFCVYVKAFDRTVVFVPSLQLWFEVIDDSNFESRMTEVLQKHFREQLKSNELAVTPESTMISGDGWVTTIDMEIPIKQESDREGARKLLALWSTDRMDGMTELNRVGRCLDSLYPDDLESAVGRDEQVELLDRLLSMHDRRPILLVGDPLVGKTAIIHEVVRRRVERRKKPHASRRNIWLLSPQRLISGMSYVGQWENRFLAIVAEAKKQSHVLYFDDILGLFRAGQSRDSNLALADLVKKELLDRNIRILGEMTTAAFERLSSQSIGFADHFHVIRIDETTEAETWKIAVNVIRREENRQRCDFHPSAVSQAMQLQRQYVKQACFPGKVAKFLRELAVKHYRGEINQQSVLTHFLNTSGINISLLDDRVVIERESVESFLKGKIIGQTTAIDACTDVVMMAKARLNQPEKPLATMLFVGPTGVGKTESAKALSEFLFQNSEQMIRFDLNEFKTQYAASRLIGTFQEPEGLLTSAVRQKPYCVLLLDEIEKAHHDVFDMLLQVTGEGRLTDALGRTTDFSNAVIIMTSNIGTRTASQKVGFESTSDGTHYISAAQKFFRPEFFNRIDRVVPFASLTQTEIGKIAELMMQQVVSRQGLVRRRCILRIDPKAIMRVVEVGYDAELGARAMKRTIETHFTQPVAARLSSMRADTPTIVYLSPGKQTQFDVRVIPLENVEQTQRPTTMPATDLLIDKTKAFTSRIEQLHLQHKPQGAITAGKISTETLRYYAVAEQINQVNESVNTIRDYQDQLQSKMQRPALPITGTRSGRTDMDGRLDRNFLNELNSVRDVHHLIDETIHQKLTSGRVVDSKTTQLLNGCALLEQMVIPGAEEIYFYFQHSVTMTQVPKCKIFLTLWFGTWEAALADRFEFVCTRNIFRHGSDVLNLFHVKGFAAERLLTNEVGSQLFCDNSGRLHLLQSGMVPVNDSHQNMSARENGLEANCSIEKDHALIQKFAKLIADQNAESGNDKTLDATEWKEIASLLDERASAKVLRMHDFRKQSIDFRTGEVSRARLDKDYLFRSIVSGYPLPVEFESFINDEPTPAPTDQATKTDHATKK